MDSNLAMILMTATFVLGVVYGSLPKFFPTLRKATSSSKIVRTRPLEATFVALFSTYLPRNIRAPRRALKRVPERVYWVGDEDPILPAP